MNLSIIEKNNDLVDFCFIRDQLKCHVRDRSRQAFEKGDRDRDEIQSVEQLKERQKYIRETFIKSIGELPASDCPLDAVTTGTVAGDGFTIEKVMYRSRPECRVTASLYIPDNIVGKSAAVLFVVGHSASAKQYAVYQSVCQTLALSGLIVLIQDPPGQGERHSYYEKSIGKATVTNTNTEHDYDGCRCLLTGGAIARYFVHDAIRSIDYLCTRSEVDSERIGITGSSGGGTQTCMVMMCEPRIAAAAPGTFVMNRRSFLDTGNSQDAEQNWPGLSAAGIDHEDFLIAMAPRPVLLLAAKYDFFPIEGTRETLSRTKRFWEMFGKGENVGIHEYASQHMYSLNLACAAGRFFSRHLLGEERSADIEKVKPFPEYVLNCTKSGQVRGDYPDTAGVFELNRERYRTIIESKKDIPQEKQIADGIEWLRERIYAYRTPCDINYRLYGQRGYYGLTFRKYLWRSQSDVMNHALLVTESMNTDKKQPITIAIWEGGTSNLREHMPWIRNTCSEGRAVLILDVSGIGGASPSPVSNFNPLEFNGTVFKLAYDLIWLNDSLAAMRTYDVLRSLDFVQSLEDIDGNNVDIYGNGAYGVYGLLAAFADERIKNVSVPKDMQSYADIVSNRYYEPYDAMSIVFPGILERFDITDIKKHLKEKVREY